MNKTFNPCDECAYSFSKQNKESRICRICEFKKMLELEKRLQTVYGKCDGLLEKVVEHLERHEGINLPDPVFKARLLTDGEVDRWEGYKELEEQGKLLKLPCANWMEIVFGNQEVFWGIDMDYTENTIREITVDSPERMTWYDGWKTVVLKGADENGLDWEFPPEEIGKTVFLTREEAEAALKELCKTAEYL